MLPVNIEAEQGILGSILLNNKLLPLVSGLQPEHFSEPLHTEIFSVCLDRIARGELVSILTLQSFLARDDPPNLGVTLREYFARLCGAAIAPIALAGVARQVHRLAAQRQLRTIGSHLDSGAALIDPQDSIQDVQSTLVQISTDLAVFEQSDKAGNPVAAMEETRERMSSGEYWKGARTGFDSVDRIIGGFAPSDLIVLAGRPGMGKTMTGLSFARRSAHLGYGVVFLSLEMSANAVWRRLVADETEAHHTKIAYNRLDTGRVSVPEYEAAKRSSERLVTLPLRVIDFGDRLTDIPRHIHLARKWLERRDKQLDLFIVDYLGRIRPTDKYRGQKVNEIGEISAALKAYAKSERVAIIALHQLSRGTEHRDDQRPRLSDLRDSGNLEQDADVVAFCYRPSYYIERPGYRSFPDAATRAAELEKVKHDLEIIISKQRQGAIGTAHLWCDMAMNAIREKGFD